MGIGVGAEQGRGRIALVAGDRVAHFLRLDFDRLVLQLDSWLTVSEGREALAAHAENFPGTVQLEDDAASIANFCLDGIGFVMAHAGEPEIYFMINR